MPATPPDTPPPPAPPVISPELEQILAFISDENKRHRDYFDSLYARTLGFLKWIGVVVTLVATFFGISTFESINAKVDKAVTNIGTRVDSRIDAQFQTSAIKEIVREAAASYTDASSLFALAKDGDGSAFDRIVSIANDPTQPDVLQKAARSIIESIQKDYQNEVSAPGCGYPGSSISVLISHLKSNNKQDKLDAIGCLDPGAIWSQYPWPSESQRPDGYSLSPKGRAALGHSTQQWIHCWS